MASIELDRQVGGLYLRLKRGKVSSTEPLADNIILDLDSEDEVLGIELLLPPGVTKKAEARLAPIQKRRK